MKRVLVLAEGQTEERFIKDVLNEYFLPRGVTLIPKVATTKRVKQGPDFKGGITDYQKVKNDLRRLLGDTGVSCVTTFIDYYGLPGDFPGMPTRPSGSPQVRARHVEVEWERLISHPKFHAYLMIHEFEALLFARPEEICRAFHSPGILAELEGIRASFQTPEDINDDPQTAPSKRIIQVLPGYQKTVHGPMLTKRTGLDILRSECHHFSDWLGWLEGL